ncbi:MAG: hypothetical protein H6742_09985 [Alphaproteobacteria bacterium]|nr:hypothetical protein [Alphaproteobacteria bacterium]
MSVSPPSPERLPRPVIAALSVGAAVAFGAAAARPGVFFVDDAWFYLQIARNLADGAGSTFHGDGPTNGYHPLWLGVVTLLALLAGGGKGLLLGLVLVVQAALVALAGAALFRTAALARTPFPGVALGLVTVCLLTDRGWGSEGMLNLALHGGVLWAWARALDRDRIGDFVLAGLLGGLLFLARLDTAFFALGLLASTAALHPRRSRFLPLGVGMAVIVLPFLAWQQHTWGHAVPVSGAIKSTFPVPDATDLLGKLGRLGGGVAALSGVGALLALRRNTPGRPLLLALGLGAVGHAAYTGLFTAPRWSTDVVYYYVTGVVGAGFTLAELCRRYLSLLPSLTPAAGRKLVAAFVLVLVGGGVGRAVRSAVTAPTRTEAFAGWMADHLPPGSKLLTVDAPGRLAWVSGLPVHALDGLTQDYGFSAALLDPDVAAWARRVGITHVVSQRRPYPAPWARVEGDEDGITITVLAPATGEEAGVIVLDQPPLASLCEVAGEPGCGEDVGVWVWGGGR